MHAGWTRKLLEVEYTLNNAVHRSAGQQKGSINKPVIQENVYRSVSQLSLV